ncbi:hypothetical protein DY000_02029176 [Brassica cretica]|uniref:Uncharacterized protein n=1 Tax=Brassica cretica TaxID=69181 RepID=A0ABQ7DR93_BRACR|nr:hypothetical protein DY000_02029176 [Brassica cretica]
MHTHPANTTLYQQPSKASCPRPQLQSNAAFCVFMSEIVCEPNRWKRTQRPRRTKRQKRKNRRKGVRVSETPVTFYMEDSVSPPTRHPTTM